LCEKGDIPMKTENVRTVLWHYVRKILLIVLLVFIITALICWLGGWHTLNNFGTGLMIAGFGAFVLGGFTALGGYHVARDPTYRYIQSVMPNSLAERTRRDWIDMMDSFSFLILMCSAGLLSMVGGWLVTAIFP
jgi:hypothetical protein